MSTIARNYIDKNHAVSLSYCYEQHPIDPYYQDDDKGSSRNVLLCHCKFDGAHFDTDRKHDTSCEILEMCKSLGVSAAGVTAAYIGSTENGEYEHVYVYYGSDPYRKSARYFPVHRGLTPMQKLIELAHIGRLAVPTHTAVHTEQTGPRSYAIHSSVYVCDDNGFAEYFTFTARLTWGMSDYIPTLTKIIVTASHDRQQHSEVKAHAWDAVMDAIGQHATKMRK